LAIVVAVGLVLAIGLAYALGLLPFSLIRPPITWVRPVRLHVGEVDYSAVWLVCGPVSGASASLYCPSKIDSDVYFTGPSKPSGVAQYEYKESGDSWAWFVDLADEKSCTPNVGIAFRKIYETPRDPVTGLMSVAFDYEIILSCDPWLSGAVVSPECGAMLRNSYIEILIDTPYYLHKVFIDGVEKTFYYDTSGRTKLIIPVPHDIPETNALAPSEWSWLFPLWVKIGKQFKHRMVLQVQTGVVQETAETTIVPAATLRVGPTGVTTVYGTGTVTYTAPVPTKTTITVTEFRTVSKTVYVTTQYGGQTVTVTSYIPGGITVYNTATFTLPIVVTKVTTATVTAPTTITHVVTKEVTREEMPPWAWIMIGVLGFFAILLIAMNLTAARAHVKRQSPRRGRRRR